MITCSLRSGACCSKPVTGTEIAVRKGVAAGAPATDGTTPKSLVQADGLLVVTTGAAVPQRLHP